MICSGATAYPSLIDFKRVREICDEVGAIMWVDAAHFIGLVAGKAIPSTRSVCGCRFVYHP